MKTPELVARRDKRRPGDVVHEPAKKFREDPRKRVDVRSLIPSGSWPVRNQLPLPSCTAHAAVGVAHFAMIRSQRRPLFQPSRLFVYHCEVDVASRDHQFKANPKWLGTVRYAMDIVKNYGVCADVPAYRVPSHAVWPYKPKGGAHCGDGAHPPPSCFEFAKRHRIPEEKYFLGNDLARLRGCLAEGHPFTFRIDVHAWGVCDFNFAASPAPAGFVVMPKNGDIQYPSPSDPLIMSHAMIAVGYDDRKQRFIIRNSMGTKWGRRGYGTIPYQYLLDPKLADSFWTLRLPKP